MAFEILHGDSAPFAAQAQIDSIDFEILFPIGSQQAVIRGCEVTADSGLQVDVAAGYVKLSSGLALAVANTNPTHDAADATDPRWDIVVVNSSGTVAIRKGAASASNAVFPTLTSGDIALCATWIPATDTVITDTQIVDKRIFTWGPVFMEKTANETMVSDTALQNDNHLKFTMGANEDWAIELFLYYTAPWNAGDFKAAWTHPTGSTFKWGGHRISTAVTSSGGNVNSTAEQAGVSGSAHLAGGAMSGAIGGIAEMCLWRMRGKYEGGANAGDLQLQWAQNVTDTETVTVYVGSTLRVMRLT